MSEEQLHILKMIEERKISAEDGAKLLNALNAANTARVRAAEATTQAQNRWHPGGWAWGGEPGASVPPVPPIPPIPPIPPMPPMPEMPGFGFDPFDAAFGKVRERERDARNREREARLREREAHNRQREQENRRRRRDTETLDSEPGGSGSGARFLRIRVTESGAKHATVNVNLPIGLVNFGLKLAGRYIPDSAGIEMQAISEAIQSGAIGKIIDVQESGDDERPGARVEISVE